MSASQIAHDRQIFIDPHSALPKTYFDLIEKVGASGKYQRMMFYIFVFVFFVTGSILMSTSFIFMNDRYACQQLGLLVSTCKKTVCEIEDQNQRQQFFIDNKEGIRSVATDYGPFICDDQFLLDLIKSCPYFGSLIGFLISSLTADNIGRKMTMTIALGVASLGSLMVVLGFNLTSVTIGVILSGAGINVASALCFCFLGQTVENLKRQKYSILIQISYTVGSMFITGLYYLIGNWRIISIILQAIPVTITFFFFVLYAQETPLFLLKGQNKKALKALNRIGYINFGIKDILTEEDIENVRMQQLSSQKFNNAKVSPLDLMRFPSLRRTTIVSCLLGYIVLSMYYGPALIIESIGFNTYVSSFAIQLSQLIGYIPCYFFIDKVKRRSTGFWLFIATVVSSFILSVIKKPEGCEFCLESIIEVIVIFFFRFAIATEFILFLVYIVELYPARVVGIGMSAVNSAGTIASTLSPIILGALTRIEFNLMIFFFILGVVGSALTLLLEETHNKPIKADIQEIQYAKNKRKTEYISGITNTNQSQIPLSPEKDF